MAAYGYHTLVIGRKQYWLQNGFNLNAYTDFNNVQWPALRNVLITSDSYSGFGSGTNRIYCALPGTIILSPGFADPNPIAYVGGSEPCRTTGSIRLTDACGITNLRVMSLAAYQYSLLAAANLDGSGFGNNLIWGPINGGATEVGGSGGMLYVPAGGGTAVQIDGDYCYVDDLSILGFRNAIVCVPQQTTSPGCGKSPRIGRIQVDTANAYRTDQSNASGRVT